MTLTSHTLLHGNAFPFRWSMTYHTYPRRAAMVQQTGPSGNILANPHPGINNLPSLSLCSVVNVVYHSCKCNIRNRVHMLSNLHVQKYMLRDGISLAPSLKVNVWWDRGLTLDMYDQSSHAFLPPPAPLCWGDLFPPATLPCVFVCSAYKDSHGCRGNAAYQLWLMEWHRPLLCLCKDRSSFPRGRSTIHEDKISIIPQILGAIKNPLYFIKKT